MKKNMKWLIVFVSLMMPEVAFAEEINVCSGQSLRAFQIIGYLIYVAKMVIPLLLVVLGSIDLAKGVIATNEKPNKDSLMAFVRRLIIAVVIFLIPTVLDFLLSFVDGANDTMDKYSVCTTCLLDPLGDECQNGVDE